MSKSAVLLFVLVLIASCLLITLSAYAEPRTIIVPGDYPTIATALKNAASGSTIFVKKGTYVENMLVIDKPLTLLGEDANDTILKMMETVGYYEFMGYQLSYYNYGIKIVAPDVTISGLTITNGTGTILYGGNYAINVTSSRVQITGNIVADLNGIHLGGSNIKLSENDLRSGRIECYGTNNRISANKIVETHIELWSGFSEVCNNTIYDGDITLVGNEYTIANNSISHGSISLLQASNNTIEANRLMKGNGFILTEGSNNTFRKNQVEDCLLALDFRLADYQTRWIDGNIIYHNNFINNIQQIKTDWRIYGSNRFDNGKEGNYWSDYNGTDENRDGIGDTPYCAIKPEISDLDASFNNVENASRQDNYPLMFPFDIENNAVVLPPPEPFPTTIVFSVSVVILAVVAMGVLVYFRKRKHKT